jgi:hypothetical protein
MYQLFSCVDKKNGLLGRELKKGFVPLQPQPAPASIVVVKQKYSTLSRHNFISQAVENFRCYNVVLKFATIPPASLLNVADHFSHKFSQEDSQIILNEQKNFEFDVDLLNSFIMSVNIHGTRTVRWDKDLVKIHFKRRGTNKKLKKVVHYRYVDMTHYFLALIRRMVC